MNKVIITGVDTSTLPKLSQKETDRLLREIKNGNNSSRDYFIKGNIRLVLSIVGRFSHSQVCPDDLFQAGMIGLLKALNNFNVDLDVRFSTYAVPLILGEVKRCVRDRTGIKVSRNLRDTAYLALKAREKLSLDSEKEPSLYEIAEEIALPIYDVACALDAVSDTISFFEPAFNSDDEDCALVLDQIADEKQTAENWTENISLYEAMKNVPEREIQVVKMRYFEGKTQTEISQIVGISQAQVSRLEKSAIEKLRSELNS